VAFKDSIDETRESQDSWTQHPVDPYPGSLTSLTYCHVFITT